MSTVLVINAGSSSIKYQLLDPHSGNSISSGIVERIGEPTDGHYHHVINGEVYDFYAPIPDHHEGLRQLLQYFEELGPRLEDSEIIAVGHRIVQGGSIFSTPALATPQTIQQVKDLACLAPLHNGPEAIGVEVMQELLPTIPQVLIFDTSYFTALPEHVRTYALNTEIARKYHIQRYGAHGTSHEYVGEQVPQLLGKSPEGFRQIVLHIGNGASASAQISGKPIETSMGLTPLEGLVMGSRTGDIDPASVFYLMREAHMTADELDSLYNQHSGLFGLTGFGDIREVHRLIKEGNADAQLALDIYVHRIVSYIGAYWAQLGGLDAITFTAGVGEHDDVVRARSIGALAHFGIKLDPELNKIHGPEPRIISTPNSSVAVCIVPTNEELVIARKAEEVAKNGDKYGNVFTPQA